MEDGIVDLVLGLNAQAIALLQNDEFDPAIEDLRTALDQMRHISNRAHKDASLQLWFQISTLGETAYRRVLQTGDVILGHGFLARGTHLDESQLSLQDTSLVVVIILFNLGLAYHLRGASTFVNPFNDLRMALTLYKFAMDLSIEQLVPMNPNIALLLVAMGNNTCSVAATLGELDELHLALERTKEYSQRVPEQVTFFWSNVTFWTYLKTSPAPAA